MSIYKCEICGKLFDRVGNGKYCSGPHYHPCPVCGKPVQYSRPNGPFKCCSKECTNIKRAKTKQSNLPMRKCEICGKMYQPNDKFQKYCKGPHKSTCVICGEDFEYICNPSDAPSTCSQECQNYLRISTTGAKFKYIKHDVKTPHWKRTIDSNSTDSNSTDSVDENLKVELNYVLAPNPLLEIQQFIESLNISVIRDYKLSDNVSIGLWIPKYNTGVMYSDFYDISGYYSILDNSVFVVSSEDWKNRQNLIQNNIMDFLKKRLTTYLVKPLTVGIVDSDVARSFMFENGLYTCKNFNVALGLYNSDNDLLSVMTFGLLDDCCDTTSVMHRWEITSMCTKLGVRVTSGYKKLIKQFIYRYIPSKLFISKISVSYNIDLFVNYSEVFTDNAAIAELTISDYCKMKNCILCGKPFVPKTSAQCVCYDKHYRTCKFCGKEFEIERPSSSQQCCSEECTVKLRQSTMIDRYGVANTFSSPELMKKVDQTNLERYGTTNPMSLDTVKEKLRQTNIKRYGVTSKNMLQEVKDRMKQTCMERYGVPYTSQIPGHIEKMRKTNLIRYGVEYPLQSEDIKRKLSETNLEKYGVPWYCMSEDYLKEVKSVISKVNRYFSERLTELGIENKLEEHIGRYGYDIYIPDSNLFIEINPTYTHNAIGDNFFNRKLDKYYHQNKSKIAEEHGYHCIHIFDWMDLDDTIELIKDRDRLHFSEFTEPKLWMSKKDKAFEVKDMEDVFNLIDAGWYPVYDSGQIVTIIQ